MKNTFLLKCVINIIDVLDLNNWDLENIFVFSGEWQDQKNHHFQAKNKSLFQRMKFLQNSLNFLTKREEMKTKSKLNLFYIVFNEYHWFLVFFKWNWGISFVFHLTTISNEFWVIFWCFCQHPPNFFFSSNWASILIQQKFQNVVWSRFWLLRLNIMLLFQQYIPSTLKLHWNYWQIIVNFND